MYPLSCQENLLLDTRNGSGASMSYNGMRGVDFGVLRKPHVAILHEAKWHITLLTPGMMNYMLTTLFHFFYKISIMMNNNNGLKIQ